ncbi:MAG: mitofilin family membrane protein, partial [Proteobacteria bacterium]|nr:mitofilin family membrane protein [Pseudomonadota bacterium]
FPGLLPASAPDPMVAGLVGRMTALETQLRERADAADSLAKLEAERQQFSGALKTIIDRLETVEGQLSDVRRMAEAASGAPTVGAANQSLKEIRDRLTRVEQSGGETSAVLQRLSELEKSGGELSEVRKRVDALQAAGGDARTMTKTLSVIEGRLAELEQARVAAGVTSTTTDAKARALVLAVAQLRDTVRRGAGFAADLETLSDLAAGDTDVAAASATLARHAKTGIPTLAMLREQFDGLAGHLLSAARSAPDDTWWQRAANQVSALVSVRRVGTDADGNSLDAVIARAENLMRAGDLTGAVAAIDGAAPQLNEAAMALAKPWLKSAKARLSAERALTALHVKAVALLVPASG